MGSTSKAIVISSGHGQYIRGAKGFLDEVDEARRIVDAVAKYLREHGATVYVYHDNTSRTQRDNLNAIVAYHNSKQRVLDVSVHLNAASTTDAPRGCEVLYYDAKQSAANVSKALAVAGGFKDRGAKERRDLAFLAGTREKALLIETCFVDSRADADLYRRNFDAICVSIAVALAKEAGITLTKPNQPTQSNRIECAIDKGAKVFRIQSGAYKTQADAEKAAQKAIEAGAISYATIRGTSE